MTMGNAKREQIKKQIPSSNEVDQSFVHGGGGGWLLEFGVRPRVWWRASRILKRLCESRKAEVIKVKRDDEVFRQARDGNGSRLTSIHPML